MKKLALALGLVLASWLLPHGFAGLVPQDVAALAAEIKQKRDDVEPEKIRQLAALRTREAAEALIEAYDGMASLYMRLEILRLFPTFDGVADAEQKALQKLTDIATGAPDSELRDAAIEALGQCKNLGKHFLQMIVESAAEDAVREHAMRAHVGLATEADQPWYQQQYGAGEDSKADKK